MPRVKAKRFFISAQYGNVESGDVLDVTDTQAAAFVAHGFVVVLAKDVPPKSKTNPASEKKNPLDFSSPVGDQAGPGSLSQAGKVSQRVTAKKSESGDKKKRKTRGKKK